MGCIYTEAKNYPREPAAHVAISELSGQYFLSLLFMFPFGFFMSTILWMQTPRMDSIYSQKRKKRKKRMDSICVNYFSVQHLLIVSKSHLLWMRLSRNG
jgi:hypothetical protein